MYVCIVNPTYRSIFAASYIRQQYFTIFRGEIHILPVLPFAKTPPKTAVLRLRRRFTMLFRMKRQSILWLGFAFRWRAGDFHGELWDIDGS
jgi:hypothetical protein